MNVRMTPLFLAAALSILAGCATALDVGYPERGANRGELTSVAPRRVVVGPITDRRMDQTRIGAKPNEEAIGTRRPVVEIVREALVVELTKNGHAVVPAEGDIRLAADVEEFWLDAAGRNSTTQYVGRVGLALAVKDGRSGATLLIRRYAGIKRRQGEADSKDAWRDVMDTALARAVRDIATDPAFVAALSPVPISGQRGEGASRAGRAAGDL
jgi:uncharacterized lipoprotein YajG